MTLKLQQQKTCETKKNFVKLWQIHEISVNFSCFVFISSTYAHILIYFVQLCDGMNAAFRNSDVRLYVLPNLYVRS